MPFSFEFDAGHRLLRVRLEGRITDFELMKCYSECFERVAAVKPGAAIFDGTEILAFDVSVETIRYLALYDPPFPANIPRFIVAPMDSFYGMIRIFQIRGEELRPGLQVVRSLADAYRDLGISEVHFEPLPSAQS